MEESDKINEIIDDAYSKLETASSEKIDSILSPLKEAIIGKFVLFDLEEDGSTIIKVDSIEYDTITKEISFLGNAIIFTTEDTEGLGLLYLQDYVIALDEYYGPSKIKIVSELDIRESVMVRFDYLLGEINDGFFKNDREEVDLDNPNEVSHLKTKK